MTVAESGRRGYIVSGSEQELKRHLIAVDDMQSKIQTLQRQMSDNPIEQQRIAKLDRKSTRLNSSHANISYAVFCLKKKNNNNKQNLNRVLLRQKKMQQITVVEALTSTYKTDILPTMM